jgi:antitoxin Phd
MTARSTANEWKLAEAKNRFTEVVNKALTGQPQIVHRRADTVVILSKDEYERLTGKKPNFIEHLLNMPKMDDDFVIPDRTSYPRDPFE